MTIDTPHHVATFTVTMAAPRLTTRVAATSGAIATMLASNVRRGELGTAIARAITVFAHANSPA